MDRSLGFGLHPATHRPIKTPFLLKVTYSVKLATECKSLTHYTKRYAVTPLGRSHYRWCIRFQVLFHSLPGVPLTFPSRYWSTIGRWWVCRLGGRSHISPDRISRVPGPTFRTLRTAHEISEYGTVTHHGRRTSQLVLPISTVITHRLLRVRSPLLAESHTERYSLQVLEYGSSSRVRFSKSMYST